MAEKNNFCDGTHKRGPDSELNIELEDPDKLRGLLTDFYSIFPDIRHYIINQLITRNVSIKTNYTKNPLVDVRNIAKKINLKLVEFSFMDFYNTLEKYGIDIKTIPNNLMMIPKHAVLAYKEAIIFIDKNDSKQEKLFSIAHEIFHFLFLKDRMKMPIIADKKTFWTKQLENQFKIGNQGENDSLAARFAARENKEVRKEFKAVLRNIPLEQDEVIKLFSDALKKNISDIVEDEIADYFAANLLVPLERFVLWDDKPDIKIARAFNTPIRCIEKRKKEVENEHEILKPKELSSGICLEKGAPFLHIHTIGDNGIHGTMEI